MQKSEYRQLIMGMTRLVVDLSIENAYLREKLGEVPKANLMALPEVKKLYDRVAPALLQLEKALVPETEVDQPVAEALQEVLGITQRR